MCLFKWLDPGPWGDLIKNMENTQDEVDILKLGFQHTYLNVRFNNEKIQAKTKEKQRETDWLLKEGCFLPD